MAQKLVGCKHMCPGVALLCYEMAASTNSSSLSMDVCVGRNAAANDQRVEQPILGAGSALGTVKGRLVKLLLAQHGGLGGQERSKQAVRVRMIDKWLVQGLVHCDGPPSEAISIP